jgi:hypothetical protein
VSSCLATKGVKEVILVDNYDLEPATNLRDLDLERVTYIRPAQNLGSCHRFHLAAEMPPHRTLMCIDDDILPSSDQIDALFTHFESNPDRLHGLWGEDIQWRFGRVAFKTHVCEVNRPVDILNRLYVFLPAQARRAIALAHQIGFEDWHRIGPGTDILMSFAGVQKPFCHSVGPIESCETADAEGIAIWRRPGFYQQRMEIVRRLRALPKDPTQMQPADGLKRQLW